ncbi:MAG: DUF29 domain-containing protein [Aeromonas sp.]
MSITRYDTDVVAWANEQAAFIRAGRFELMDLVNLAEEIEDVGKSEARELASRWAVLLTHLLKWKFQPIRRGSSWQLTIKEQRDMIQRRLQRTPSLKSSIKDQEWLDDAWTDAKLQAAKETEIAYDVFPSANPWNNEQILSSEFFPD